MDYLGLNERKLEPLTTPSQKIGSKSVLAMRNTPNECLMRRNAF
jgi:hypothetical protein